MSGYDEVAGRVETEQQQRKGAEAFLSQQEREQVRRYLKFPEEFPQSFGAWIADYIGTHAVLQRSQVQGLPLVFTQVADTVALLEELSQVETDYESANVSTTSSSYVDLTGGPGVAGLDDGTYLAICIAYAANASGESGSTRFRIHANGVATGIEGTSFRNDGLFDNITIAAVPAVTAGDGNNEIKVMYRKQDAAGTANYRDRFLILMRVA